MNLSLSGKLLEVRRSSENQMTRCKIMLKKLKLIELQELEDFGEKQMESVVKVLAEAKEVKLKEATVPEFLQKRKLPIPPVDAFEEEDYVEEIDPSPPPVWTKHGVAELQDVSQMLRHNIRELLLSTVPLGKEEVDTDSCSDYEDEVQAIGSTNNCTNWRDKDLKYLMIEHNPGASWGKVRLTLVSRFAWLKDSIRTLDQRLKQHDQLLQYIKLHKPAFKFDEAVKVIKPVIIGSNLDFATIKLYREEKNEIPGTYSSTTTISPVSGNLIERTDNLVRTIGNAERLEGGGKRDGRVGGGLEPLKLKILESSDPTCIAHRCIAVCRPYRHRKVLQIGGIHNVVGKPVKQPSTMCGCFGREELCIICSGRSDKVKQIRPGAMARGETTALLDHNYHKVLSATDEKPLRLLTEAALKTTSWDKSKKPSSLPADAKKDARIKSPEKPAVKKRMFMQTQEIRPVIDLLATNELEKKSPQRGNAKKAGKTERKSRKRKRVSDDEDEDEDDELEMHWAPKKIKTSDPQRRRRADEKYDIDHIVIPYSIAAATRVEKIEYKEIDIPSWRIEPVKIPEPPKTKTRNTRTSRSKVPEVELEDMRLETVMSRHARSEEEEKKRFLSGVNLSSNRRSRRSETKAENEISQTGEVSPPIRVNTSDNIFAKDEIGLSSTPSKHSLSAADASLAITALKYSAATPSTSSGSSVLGRRRTISITKIDEDESEEPGVPPYEPRKFPLSDEDYAAMVKEMDEAYEEEENRERRDPDSIMLLQQKLSVIDDESDGGGSEVDDPDWREVTETSAAT